MEYYFPLMCYTTITSSFFFFFFAQLCQINKRENVEHDSTERLYLENVPNQKQRFIKKQTLQLPVSWVHRADANLACTCSAAAASNNTQACIQSEACRIHTAGVAELGASPMIECACKSPAVHDLKPGNMSDFSCLRLLRATCFLQPCGCLSCPRGG